MLVDTLENSLIRSKTNHESVIKKYPYAVILLGSIGFSFLNLFNESPFRAKANIEWHDIIAQWFIIFILLGWVKITIRSKTTSKTYNNFYFGCANLIWLMTIKFFGELFVEQTSILTTFELVFAVSGLLLITLGLMSWSKEFQTVIENLKISTSNYRVLSERDPLTGLLNRGQFDSIMKYVIEKKHALSLIIVDLDHFKSINDQYGHPIGDLVIKRTSKLLSAHLRDKDYAFRLGGEEFALLFVQCPEVVVEQRAQTILMALANEQFPTNDHEVFSITASLGVVHLGINEQPSTVYRRADSALYQAKANGRNQVVVL